MNRYQTPGEALVGETREVFVNGSKVESRGQLARELLVRTFEVLDPTQFIFRLDGHRLNHTIGRMELCSLIGESPADVVQRTYASGRLGQFHDDNVQWGNYGCRIRGQVDGLVDILREDSGSRQAVLSIYDGGRDLYVMSKDIPCTLTIQFFVRDGRLNMHVSMRSNDVWLGLPYDLMQFCALQCTLAQVLDFEVGSYFHTAGSQHLYERNLEDAEFISLTEQKSMYPLWKHRDLAYIRHFCQSIISNRYVPFPTEFETWLRTGMGHP